MAEKARSLDMTSVSLRLRRLTMAELRALAAIKAAGTLSGAAEALGVTQPSLSQHVREIEGKLGATLFDRHRRGVDPTRVGAVLLRLAEAMRFDFAHAAEEFSIALRADARPIRIGSMPLTSAGLLAVALGRFASGATDPVPSVIFEGARETLLESLRHDRIDVFVGRLPDEEACAGLQREVLFLDTAVVIGSARHRLANRASVKLDMLDDYGWVISAEETAFHQQIAQALRRAGREMPAARVHSHSMLAIPAIVASSELLGFMPASLFASGTISQSLRQIAVDLEWVPAPVGVLIKPEISRDERLQPFLRTLRSVAASARVAVPRR